MSVNRYTKLTPAKFDPYSFQELMAVPAYKREQHDNLDAGIAEIEGKLAEVDPLDVHSNLAKQEQERLYNDLLSQRDKLSSEGFNQRNRGDFLKLNKDYQQTVGPMGTIGKINQAKKQFELEKKSYIANAIKMGYSPEDAAANWDDEALKYTDSFKTDGIVKNIESFYAPEYVNAKKELVDLFSKAGISQTDIANLGTSYFKKDENGKYVITTKGYKKAGSNVNQLQAAVDYMNNQVLDPNSKVGKSIKHQRRTSDEVLKEISGLGNVFMKTNNAEGKGATISNVQNETGGSIKQNNSGGTSAITTNTKKIVEDAEDARTKIQSITDQIKRNDSVNTPDQQVTKYKLVKQKRKINRLYKQAEASNEVINDPKLKAAKVAMDNEVKEKELLLSQINQLKDTYDKNGEWSKVQDIEYRLDAIEKGEDFTVIADWDKLKGTDEYNLFNDLSSLDGDRKYNKIKDDLVSGYLKRQGDNQVEFVTSSNDSQDKVLVNNLTKVLSSIDFNIENIEGLADYDKIPNISDKNGGKSYLNKQFKDLIASGSNHVINFGTNGVDPYLSVSVTPKKESKLTTKYMDGLSDKEFDGSERITTKTPLLRYNNRNIPQLTDFSVHLLNNSKLDAKTKHSIMESIYTSGISFASSKDDIGEGLIGSNFLGKNASKLVIEHGYDGFDFYKPIGSNKSPIQTYKIKKDDKGNIIKKDLVLLKDIIPNALEDSSSLISSGILPTYENYANNVTVGSMLKQFGDNIPNDIKKELLSFNQSSKIISNFDIKNSNSKDYKQFIKLINNLPLLVKDIKSLVQVSNSTY